MMAQDGRARGYLYIAIAAFCWGAAAAVAQAIFRGRWLSSVQAAALGPLALSETRVTISFALFAPCFIAQRRAGGRKIVPLGVRPAALALVMGAFGIASNYLYYVSIQKTTVATGIILQYLAPIWVLGFTVARGWQRAAAARLLAVLLGVGGCAVAVATGPNALRYSVAGVAAGLGASFAFAFYNLAGRELLARHDRWTIYFVAMLGATVLWMIVRPPWLLIAEHYSRAQWEFLTLFSVASVLLPYLFYFAGLKYMDATRAIVTACLEPVFAILLAMFTVGEGINLWQGAGIAAVLAGTIVVQRGE